MSKSEKIRIPTEDRTLTTLSRLPGRVYVYCGDLKTLQRFIEDADNEYFHYGDGVSLTERKPECIMALNRDKTVNFIGYCGTVAFRLAEITVVGKESLPLIRVDYRKYTAGYKNFIYEPDRENHLPCGIAIPEILWHFRTGKII